MRFDSRRAYTAKQEVTSVRSDANRDIRESKTEAEDSPDAEHAVRSLVGETGSCRSIRRARTPVQQHARRRYRGRHVQASCRRRRWRCEGAALEDR